MSTRFHRFRPLFILLVLFVGCAAVWSAWHKEAKQSYLQVLQRAREIGLTTTVQDDIQSSRPVEDNAMDLYARAISLAETAPEIQKKRFSDVSADMWKEIEGWSEVLALIEQATKKPVCVFPRPTLDSDPSRAPSHTDRFFPVLVDSCHVIGARAVLRSKEGDVQGALDDLRTVVRVSESMRNEPYLLSQAVRLNLCDAAVRALEMVLPNCGSAVDALEQIELTSVRGAILQGVRDQVTSFVGFYDHDADLGMFGFLRWPLFDPYIMNSKSRHIGYLCDYTELLSSSYPVAIPAAKALETKKINTVGFLGKDLHLRMGALVEKEAWMESRIYATHLAARLMDHEKRIGQRIRSLEELGEAGKTRDPITSKPYGLTTRDGTRQLKSPDQENPVWTFRTI